MQIIRLQSISKNFKSKQALKKVNLDFNSKKINGSVFYFNKSHKKGIFDHSPSFVKGSSQKISEQKLLKNYKKVVTKLNPGDVLVHHCLTAHGSYTNKSNEKRIKVTKSENKNLGHNSKKDFLKKPIEHIDITSFDSRKIISSMEKMSFVSRETANAAKIYNEMLKDKDCTIFLTLAGSTSAAGCMNIYKDLVKYNMVLWNYWSKKI